MRNRDYLLELLYNRELTNDDFRYILDFLLNHFLTDEEKNGMRIRYHEVGGKWKSWSIQYNKKKEREILNRIFSVRLKGIALEKAELHDNSRRNHDFIFFFTIYQPITVSMELPIDERSYSSITLLLNGRINDIDEKFNKILRHVEFINLNGKENNFVYSFLIAMNKDKGVYYCAKGTPTAALTKEEESEVRNFSDNIQFIPFKIWKSFICNIITSKHIQSNQHKNELIDIVGDENYIELTTDLILLKLPFKITDVFDKKEEFEKVAKKVEDVFRKYDKII